MNPLHVILTINIVLLIIAFLIIIFIFVRDNIRKTKQSLCGIFEQIWQGKTELLHAGLLRKNIMLFFDVLAKINKQFAIDSLVRKKIENFCHESGIESILIKQISSYRVSIRKAAASNLSNLRSTRVKAALSLALSKEQDISCKLLIALALLEQQSLLATRRVLLTFSNTENWYVQKISSILCSNPSLIESFIPELLESKIHAIKCLLALLASVLPRKDLFSFICKYSLDDREDLRLSCVRSLSIMYPDTIICDQYLFSNYLQVRRITIRTIASYPSENNLDILSRYFENDQSTFLTQNHDIEHESALLATYAMSSMLRKSPKLIAKVQDNFMNSSGIIRQRYAQVLSFRIDYFILALQGSIAKDATIIIQDVLRSGLYSDVLNFLNRNNDEKVEILLCSVVEKVLSDIPEFTKELLLYCNDRILLRLGLIKQTKTSPGRQHSWDLKKSLVLLAVFLGVYGLQIIMFIISNGANLALLSWQEVLSSMVVFFNHWMIWYSMAINCIYIFVIALSWEGLLNTDLLWRIKNRINVFQQGFLPSVSILAPAYNEEQSIVQSIHALLNLQYPDYELIVINDGSKDATLAVAIDAFQMYRVDIPLSGTLKTFPVRALYRSRLYPLLTLIDKENGGKADSLNAGLNYANKEYFCGIDSDSLLEPDALIKVMSCSLDSSRFFAAAGGNILPVNGCIVEQGMLIKTDLPQNIVAKFQVLEYLRAFFAGRIGLSRINCLLIISGAFGLFNKKEVIEVGGYLTIKERYREDSVGEDMELVMRLRRHLIKNGIKHVAHYVGNAHCWTEVPESLSVLYRQRRRWHRGLMENLYFHRSMIANPRYGALGLFALPYFVIFEAIGPIIEATGYVMVIVAAFLGLLNPYIFGLLFTSTVSLGVVISLASLYLSYYERSIYPMKARWKLVLLAVLENFGFRQLLSFWRYFAYISALLKPQGWGHMKRTGFLRKST